MTDAKEVAAGLTEREKQVVAWLRRRAGVEHAHLLAKQAFEYAADAIERGEHLRGGE